MYLFLPGCPSFHRFMVVYHDLSIYPSYPSITNCIFPTILEPGLSDIMATFAWVVIVRLPRATLPLPCKNPGDSLRLSEQCQMHKLYRLRFMHENPFGPKRSGRPSKIAVPDCIMGVLLCKNVYDLLQISNTFGECMQVKNVSILQTNNRNDISHR